MFFIPRDNREYLHEIFSSFELCFDDEGPTLKFVHFMKENVKDFTRYLQPDLYYLLEDRDACMILDFLPFAYRNDFGTGKEPLPEDPWKCLERLQASLKYKSDNFDKYMLRIEKKAGRKLKFLICIFIDDVSLSNNGGFLRHEKQNTAYYQEFLRIIRQSSRLDFVIYKDFSRQLQFFEISGSGLEMLESMILKT